MEHPLGARHLHAAPNGSSRRSISAGRNCDCKRMRNYGNVRKGEAAREGDEIFTHGSRRQMRRPCDAVGNALYRARRPGFRRGWRGSGRELAAEGRGPWTATAALGDLFCLPGRRRRRRRPVPSDSLTCARDKVRLKV
jgi:hypothetical protein